MSTTATVDFTLLLGGVACAPTSEIPFAGDYFDVRSGTYEKARLGSPTVETSVKISIGRAINSSSVGTVVASSAVDVVSLGFSGTVSAFGAPLLRLTKAIATGGLEAESAALGSIVATSASRVLFVGWSDDSSGVGSPDVQVPHYVRPVSFVNGSELGAPEFSTIKAVDLVGFEAHASELGASTAHSTIFVTMSGADGGLGGLGDVDVSYTALTRPAGFSNESAVSAPKIGIRIYPAGFENGSRLGSPKLLSTKKVSFVGFESAASGLGAATAHSTIFVTTSGADGGSSVFGSPTAASIANVYFAGVENASSIGTLKLGIGIYPIGFEAGDTQVGNVTVSMPAKVIVAGIANNSSVGSPAIEVALRVKPLAVDCEESLVGTIKAKTSWASSVLGINNEALIGLPSLEATSRVTTASVENVSGVGDVTVVATVRLSLEGVLGLSGYGLPVFVPRAQVKIQSFSNDSVLGDINVGWRKVVQMYLDGEAHTTEWLEATIEDKPGAVEFWGGDAMLALGEQVEALVVAERYIDSTARRKEGASGVLKKVVNA